MVPSSITRLLELTRAGRHAEALPVWESLGEIRFRHPALLEVGAALYEQLGRHDEAIAMWAALNVLNPDDPNIVRALVDILIKCNREDDARELLMAFLPKHRGNADLEQDGAYLLTRWGTALEENRDTVKARAAANFAAELDPTYSTAQRLLVRIDHQEGHLAEARARAIAAVPMARDDAERAAILLELAQIERRLGNDEAAFEAATQGNLAAREANASSGVDAEAWPRVVAAVRGWRGRPARPTPDDNGPGPIWMVGFPRSGTTLVQQLLQSHPRIQTIDEKGPATHLLVPKLQRLPNAHYPQSLDDLTDDDWAELRAEYRHAVADMNLPEHDVLVDKLPLNVVHLDYLTRLFPNSKVLVCLRDPRDSVLSNFFQDYKVNPAMMQFSDLEGAAKSYASVMDLWLERRDRMTVPWREQRYEDLTADVEGEARALLAFLGVEWDPIVLATHELAAKRKISTPSRYDVSKPVYRTSVGAWHRFESHLAPILPTLAPYAQIFGYAN